MHLRQTVCANHEPIDTLLNCRIEGMIKVALAANVEKFSLISPLTKSAWSDSV